MVWVMVNAWPITLWSIDPKYGSIPVPLCCIAYFSITAAYLTLVCVHSDQKQQQDPKGKF